MKAGNTKERNMATEEAQIRTLVNEWAKAVREKDVDRIMVHYAKGIVLFDLAPPLKYVGADAYRKSLEEWFGTFEGAIGYEITDLEIAASGNTAFIHCINHMTGKRNNQEQTDVWIRVTVGFRKIDNSWLVTHEHVSVPFYMDGSYRAAVDLKPKNH